ncbi:MAG: cob(I)yrinic acid a,c-diamide adenosyltransferase [Epulopiscium sp. Nele67-Bin005]|nr:MAG: cob(I)yrinic acid a,c-diamide adenosyltransferase [Epulopiscium sp. Nele67-Bin005]
MQSGLIQVYYGTGKGKTTASIGLAIRAIGSNLKVIMIQFLKQDNTGEVQSLKTLEPNIKVFHFEKPRGFFWTLTDAEKEELKVEVQLAMKFAKKVMDNEECDILILDEVLAVVENGLLEEEKLCEFLVNKNENMEIVLTGRVLPDRVAGLADYITEVNEIKHPMEKGISARKGIEY